MSLYSDFQYRFSRLKNKRMDYSGSRTKKRRIVAGRYIRLYVSTHVGFEIYLTHGQAKRLEGDSQEMIYQTREKTSYLNKYIFVSTLLRHAVCLKYSQETLQLCKDLSDAVKNNQLEVYEVRSIINGESLKKAKYEVDCLKWEDKQFGIGR